MQTDYPLIEQFKHYELDFLIPLHFSSADEEEPGHTIGEYYNEVDPAEEAFYDNYLYGDAELDGDNKYEEEDDTPVGEYHLVTNMDDLLTIFNADHLEPSELLSMNIWDLFGITKKQFDLIPWQDIPVDEFYSFYNWFVTEKRPLPIEKKIRYGVAQSLTEYPKIIRWHGDECTADEMIAYAEHIIDSHTVDEYREIIPMLMDYLRFYDDAIEMDRRRVLNGENTFNYTRRPKPSHLRDLHNKAFRDHQALETERLAENRADIDRRIRDTSQTPNYQRLLYHNDEYCILAAISQDELDEEGRVLNHCVASYGSYMARGASYIYFVRKCSDPEIPYFTAEIIPPKTVSDKSYLNQLYTYNDSTAKPNSLRSFIYDWARAKGFSIKCKV